MSQTSSVAAGSRQGALPNLLIIGAAKCGTTSLHKYLEVHPEIAMSYPKELDFFTVEADEERGLDWYRGHFDPGAKIRGESSTSYTRGSDTEEIAARIEATLSQPKLIYLVRDPVVRLRSDHHQHRVVGVDKRSLADALADPANPYVLGSSYATQLAPYLERFGRDAIHVETQERLLEDRRGSLLAIFRFLGVDDTVDSEEFDRMWERSEGKGWAYALGWRLRERGIRIPGFLRWPAQRLQRSKVLGGASDSARPEELDAATEATLRARLEPEIEKLEAMTGLSFPEWRG